MEKSTKRQNLKISTRVLYDELLRQDVPVTIIDSYASLLSYTDSSGQDHLLFSTSDTKSAASGTMIAGNKYRTSLLAKILDIPVPNEIVCEDYKEVVSFFKAQKPVVIKPLSNSGGTGVTVNITDLVTLKRAYLYARHYASRIIIQQYIEGSDIRMLVIDGKFSSAVERKPAHIIGDGKSTIKELIRLENRSSRRAAASMRAMDLIDLASVARFLGEKVNNIPLKNQYTRVIGPANLSRGGTAHEATHLVTKSMIDDAEKISRRLQLGICGVDMMWNQSAAEYFLIEVNSTPGVNMHNDPFWGTSSNAIEKYVEWLKI